MTGKITYLGISRLGLMFGKIANDEGKEFYFDSRSLSDLTMADFQKDMMVSFELDNGKVTSVAKIKKNDANINYDYNKIDRMQLFNNIMNWSIEATEEDSDLFCIPEEIENIKSGSVSFVVGRKGTGKSAIVKNITAADPQRTKTVTLSFKDFPFNILYACENDEYVQPNQYISIWQYIIYYKIGCLVLQNEKLEKNVEQTLKALLTPSEEKIAKVLKRINEFSLGITVLGTGFEFGLGKNEETLSWLEQLDLLKDLIAKTNTTYQYFVLFDELDEDYKNFGNYSEKSTYIAMLTSLFKAIQHIRRNLGGVKNNIIPIVFLRTDIYNQITDSDKNKWSERLLELEWNTEKIKKIFTHRIRNSFGESNENSILDFDTAFKMIFANTVMDYGNRKNKKTSVFSYITRSTQLRPRDYIQYIKICVQIALNSRLKYVNSQAIKDADDKFSEYLKQEIIDEIFPVLPQINEIFSILSIIRKQTFNPSLFVEEYKREVENGNIEDKGAENVLKILFDYNIIGNQPSMKGQVVFKYLYKDAKFNLKENIFVHRGLYKALQIF